MAWPDPVLLDLPGDAVPAALPSFTGLRFGTAVTMSDDGLVLVVTAPLDAEHTTFPIIGGSPRETPTGAAWAYTFDGTQWGSPFKLNPSDYGSADNVDFGISAAVDATGERIAIGAPGFITHIGPPITTDHFERVTVYIRTGPSTWTVEQVIAFPGGGLESDFGTAVALDADGETLAVGAPTYGTLGTRPGAVYVYQRTTGWSTVGPETGSANLDQFGAGVALSSDGLALFATAQGSPEPRVEVDTRDSKADSFGGGVTIPNETASNAPTTSTVSVSDDGSVLATGYIGGAMVWTREGADWTGGEGGDLLEDGGTEAPGAPVAVDRLGDIVLVGLPFGRGAFADVWIPDGLGGWTLDTTLNPGGGTSFGSAVAVVREAFAAVSAPRANDDIGVVYVWTASVAGTVVFDGVRYRTGEAPLGSPATIGSVSFDEVRIRVGGS